MRDYIPYGTQWIDEDDVEAVIDVLKSDYLTQGPKIEEFEEQVANYIGVRYAVAVSSGTAALHAACFAAGLSPGDEVITSPTTFAASANCVLYMGAKPVFADIDPKTYNIDPNEIKKKITAFTKAIIPVHFAGNPCNMDEILSIAKEHNLAVIEDGAHSIGATYKGKKIGSISGLTTLSFHPVKHITTGEGGMILTNEQNSYKKLSLFRTHGITRDEEFLHKNDGPWYYEQHILGYNYRLTDIQAALGISQLAKLGNSLERRKVLIRMYNEGFRSLKNIILPTENNDGLSAWHLYVIQLRLENLESSRKQIFDKLRSKNIGVNVHYIPVYYHPYYMKLGFSRGICPNAEKYYEQAITLPLHPKMTDDDIMYIINCVKEVVT